MVITGNSVNFWNFFYIYSIKICISFFFLIVKSVLIVAVAAVTAVVVVADVAVSAALIQQPLRQLYCGIKC